ncbi:outer membrane protein assembly factor BamE [Ferrovum sp.]|uniref:outer membrane protein assembly factor BamE domain-containing protein n=1 Tax=Ferrovum sp. TaxID=2609467 RepID=UPI00262F850D|nr:outer membrane protein assembly factor BamE [Ferrovum sp.]
MFKKTIVLSALAATVMLAGCAPTDFVQPDAQKIAVGKSTWQDVLAASDHDHNPGDTTFIDNDSGKTIRVMSFVYSKGADFVGMTIQRHTQYYFFNNNILIGQLYDSTFDKDSTDFDESKASQIKEGVTNKSQVVALMGNPAGNAIYPMAKKPGDTELIYQYSHARLASVFTTTETKSFNVSFDSNGIVDRVQFNDGRGYGFAASSR